MSYPTLFTTPGVKAFAEDVDAERQRQLAKFGDQHHPDGTGGSGPRYTADRYRSIVDQALQGDGPTWRDVLLEEVYEALAEEDPDALRVELVQVAAVCAAWVSDLDSRTSDRHSAHPAPCRVPDSPDCTSPDTDTPGGAS
ncbi:hypothetical protein [Streptomyces sp. Z26]|uniref:hypothetical protein n=1 Tax=Streptomyces sp. Z26 TaxID=2500177 RepID=UPI0019CF7934|nr:hypothetical protein [Streptomyces sp. Z26]